MFKKLLIVSIFAMCLSVPAFATPKVINNNTYVNNELNSDNVIGAELDAPDLVIVNDHFSIGGEIGHNFNGTSANEGWEFVAKGTIKWTALDLRKKDK